jgi:hypothetical protein
LSTSSRKISRCGCQCVNCDRRRAASDASIDGVTTRTTIPYDIRETFTPISGNYIDIFLEECAAAATVAASAARSAHAATAAAAFALNFYMLRAVRNNLRSGTRDGVGIDYLREPKRVGHDLIYAGHFMSVLARK